MDVRRIITSLKSRGVTVFFSSHILPDVEAICDRVAILNRGRLQEQGALEEILKVRIEGHEVILSGWTEGHMGDIRKFADDVRPMGDRLQLRVSDPQKMESLLSFAFSNKLELISLNPIRQSLEDYFQSLVGSGIAGSGTRRKTC
jgi:ABC-2 type transport system ATP-binding protein